MSDIGSRMFKGGAIGGGAGLVTGIVSARSEIKKAVANVPMQSAEVPSYEKPVYKDGYVGTTDYRPDNVYGGYAQQVRGGAEIHSAFPVKNPDGTVQMEKVPAQTVTGRGKPEVVYESHSIAEPVISSEEGKRTSIPHQSWNDDDRYVYVLKKRIGEWSEPEVKFTDGINRAGIVLKNIAIYTALGIGLGTLGGALYNAAMERIEK